MSKQIDDDLKWWQREGKVITQAPRAFAAACTAILIGLFVLFQLIYGRQIETLSTDVSSARYKLEDLRQKLADASSLNGSPPVEALVQGGVPLSAGRLATARCEVEYKLSDAVFFWNDFEPQFVPRGQFLTEKANYPRGNMYALAEALWDATKNRKIKGRELKWPGEYKPRMIYLPRIELQNWTEKTGRPMPAFLKDEPCDR